MRVLVTGARGQVGHELMRCAPASFAVVGLGSAELDIADAAQVAEAITRIQPQLIINAAAYTAVDKAERDAARAFAVNRDGVANLACAAERLAIPILHISTDYVFAGDAGKAYCETDPTSPTGVYGGSKLAGEQALAEHCSRYVVLRTSWVFGAQGNNFVKTMLRLAGERDELAVVADQQGGPTSARSIAAALWQLAQLYVRQGELAWGVYHFSGAPFCSWHGFAEEIFQQAHRRGLISRVPSVRRINTEDYPTAAQRPKWSVLDCSRLNSAFGIAIPKWQLDLADLLDELKQAH